MKTLLPLILLSALATIQTQAQDAEIALFDGKSLDAWRGFKQDTLPEGWKIEDGIMVTNGKSGDVITKEKFGNYELTVEWKIEARGNSGILIRADETPQRIWHHAPEVQIFDAKPEDENLGHQAGALYALAPAKPESIKPPGEWNVTKVKILNDVITITHNDVEVVTIKVGSDDWNERVGKSKFSKFENFGKNAEGHIGLQGHGHPTWFRSITLKKL